jgi:hypothetical protein
MIRSIIWNNRQAGNLFNEQEKKIKRGENKMKSWNMAELFIVLAVACFLMMALFSLLPGYSL